MSTSFQQETAFTPAPLSSLLPSPLLWVPLDEVRQTWASFGAEALSCPALVATGTAFLALSWETSALRHHRTACQAQQRGLSQEGARWLSQAAQDLDEAVRDWRCVLLWLERLTSIETPQAHTEPLEQVRALSKQAVAQQERLRHLLEQVAAPVAPPAASAVAVTSTAVGAQEQEKEG